MADRTAARSRRPGWLPLLGAAIVVPTALAGLTQLWPRPQIEDQLTRAGGDALAAAGFPGAGLVLDGRDATITGIDPADGPRAIDAVQAVAGIRVATAPEVGGGTSTGPAPAPATAPFGIARRGADIALTGVVGSAEERTRLIEAATARAGGRGVLDELTVTAGAALPTGVSPTSVEAAAAALGGAVGPDTAIRISDQSIALTGSVADAAAKDTAGQAVAAALPGLSLDNQLRLDPALAGTGPVAAGPTAGAGSDPAAPGSAPAVVPTELDAAAKQRLQGAITQLLAGSPIAFEPNSPQLTGPGRDTVARLLELLRVTPSARLQVDGFVATGPGSGRYTAQQLSELRANTVRDALTAGAVPAAAIVTRGLGEGSSPAAQAAGRRVDITVI